MENCLGYKSIQILSKSDENLVKSFEAYNFLNLRQIFIKFIKFVTQTILHPTQFKFSKKSDFKKKLYMPCHRIFEKRGKTVIYKMKWMLKLKTIDKLSRTLGLC
jgi:hypothetical protein